MKQENEQDMRRSLLTLAALALLASSCKDLREEPVSFDGPLTLTATAEQPAETKTVIVDETRVYWEPGDAIKVFAGGTSARFTCNLTAPAATASFSGSLGGAWTQGSTLYAVYPYSEDAYLDDEQRITVTIPDVQTARPGSFDQNMHISVARSTTTSLQFFNVGGGVRFRVKDKGITKVVMQGLYYELLAANVSVMWSWNGTPAVNAWRGSSYTVTLVPPEGESLQPDTWYYIETRAETLTKGFMLTFYKGDEATQMTFPEPVEIKRGVYGNLGTFQIGSGIETSEYLQGSGTETDPFRISSLGDLLLMRERVNAENGSIPTPSGREVTAHTAYYRLTTDLDLSAVCNASKGINWTPIGDRNVKETLMFQGGFDGGGHSITGLYINSQSNYQGLFGQVSGVIRNLTVSGDVTGGGHLGLIAGYCESATLEDCISKGRVGGKGNLHGGIAGEVLLCRVFACRNEADVEGYAVSGGIVGETDHSRDVQHCTNVGSVSGHSRVGGIAGSAYGTKVIDCTNKGRVTASTKWAGGIAGYLWAGGKVINCINYAAVQGTGIVGGIGGAVSCAGTMFQGPGLIANCINVGEVVGTDGTYVGALAGFLGFGEAETMYSSDSYDGAWLKNSYWQADVNPGLQAAGGGTGIVESNYALTEAQMKGAPYDGILFVASDGSGYDYLIDALNAGAVQWSKNQWVIPGGDMRETFPLCGWDYTSPDSYPGPIDLEPQMPGQFRPVFSASRTEVAVGMGGGEFQVTVISSRDFIAESMRDWITEKSVHTPEDRPNTHVYTYSVEANNTGESRRGVVRFIQMPSTFLFLYVTQEAATLTVSETDLQFSAAGSMKRITLSSNLDWTVSSSADWFTVSPESGTGNGTLLVQVAENPYYSARTATLTVASTDGSIERTVTLTQSGRGGDDQRWKELPFHHQSLFQRFTATWCQWCPTMNDAVLKAQEQYPGKVLQLALHAGGSDLQFDPAESLMAAYGLYSFPSGMVDGRVQVGNYTDINHTAAAIITAVQETENTYGTASGLALRSTLSGRDLTLLVDSYFKQAGNYKITVLLVEDGIIGPQTNGGSDYRHDNVARIAVTDIFGELFTVDSDLSTKTFSYNVTIPPAYDLVNMRVVVYIQRAFGSAPRIQSGDYGDYYVDNSASAYVGDELALKLVE